MPDRSKRPPHNQRLIRLIGIAVLLAVLLLSGLASLGRNSAEQRIARSLGPVSTSTYGSPPNAEPFGRAWGPVDAPIQVIEYVDYECESCGYFARNDEHAVIEQFAAGGRVRFMIRNAPLHGEGARNAAAAAYCAAEQDAFWPMHDSLFLNQPQTHGSGAQAFSAARLQDIAAGLGLDLAAFTDCYEAGNAHTQVDADLVAAQQAGVTGTPTFVINGTVYPALLDSADVRRIFADLGVTP
jgi:protein-disulfide isomerase